MKINLFFKTKVGVYLLSIILGLGLACIFKMSCDSKNCIVYKAPDYSEKKVIKYNGNCYEPTEQAESCDVNKTIIEL